MRREIYYGKALLDIPAGTICVLGYEGFKPILMDKENRPLTTHSKKKITTSWEKYEQKAKRKKRNRPSKRRASSIRLGSPKNNRKRSGK